MGNSPSATTKDKDNDHGDPEPKVETKVSDEFLKASPGYGYNNTIDELREKEFGRLKGKVYLDHAGSALYAESQIDKVHDMLKSNVYANPHSLGRSSQDTNEAVERVREKVLELFNTSNAQYSVIFTAGTTASLKLVGECFPWSTRSHMCYTQLNHNSVLGIREYAVKNGAQFSVVDEKFQSISPTIPKDHEINEEEKADETFHLLAFPAECNFSGLAHNLDNIEKWKDGSLWPDHLKEQYSHGQWKVVVDAAKYCATKRMDLSKFKPDFVTISFYKLFGYPTGLGALIIKNDAARILKKLYFGGGTVEASSSTKQFHSPRKYISNWFEDGSISFVGICSLEPGIDFINKLGVENITAHVSSLVRYLHQQLDSLHHYNGQKLCEIYSNDEGSMVTFNMFHSNGDYVGYAEVERLGEVAKVEFRTGCFCNPGGCEKFLQLTPEKVIENLEAGHVCWDDQDVIDGQPTGAVRFSIGFMNTFDDIERALSFIRTYFLPDADAQVRQDLPLRVKDEKPGVRILSEILIYPLKSCGPMSAKEWPIGPRGLLLDREWMIVDGSGIAMTVKRCPKMVLIAPKIDLTTRTLTLSAPGLEDIKIDIDKNPEIPEDGQQLKVCGANCRGLVYGGEVAAWLTKFLGRKCDLVRAESGEQGDRHVLRPTDDMDDVSSAVGFANEGQFLVLSEISVREVQQYTDNEETKSANFEDFLRRFRPNLVVRGCPYPFEEDSWDKLKIGHHQFQVVGGCNRCTQVNVDPSTGSRSITVYKMLAKNRRDKGKIIFGMLIGYASDSGNDDEIIRINSDVQITYLDEN